MSKMGSYGPFGHLKPKLWPKEGSTVKLAIWLLTTKSQECQFDSRPLKIMNFHDFLVCRWHVTYNWKAFDESYNFALNLISIGGLHAKLWSPKVTRILTLGISRLPLGSPRTKWHLGAGPMAKHIVYYKREGGGFPQVRAVVSLVSPSLLVACPSTKNAPAMH